MTECLWESVIRSVQETGFFSTEPFSAGTTLSFLIFRSSITTGDRSFRVKTWGSKKVSP